MRSSPYIALIITVALLGVTRPARAQTCTFDAQGRLTMVKYSSTQTVAYAYDAAGNITNQVVSGILGEPDTNTNNLPDAWEWVWLNSLTNTAAGDFNQDTISNLKHYQDGTDPTDPDTDHDGARNVEELIAGTSPTNGQDYLKFNHILRPGGQLAVDLMSHTGRLYDIDSSSNLLNGAGWSSVTSGVAGTESTLSITNSPAPGARLYRIRVRKP
jgi:YD repeat-containing protein